MIAVIGWFFGLSRLTAGAALCHLLFSGALLFSFKKEKLAQRSLAFY